MAHYRGIRMNRVNPAGTSKMAFDGSGEVKRSRKKDIACFPTGKQYHADLNASYNIGARYFIREILKTFSEKKKSALTAKVPQLRSEERRVGKECRSGWSWEQSKKRGKDGGVGGRDREW